MAGEIFSTKGVIVKELNYLEVYKYEKWSENQLPPLREGQIIDNTELTMDEGTTKAPFPLTESDLIAKMDSNGIGTDATIHEHIKTVQERGYAIK